MQSTNMFETRPDRMAGYALNWLEMMRRYLGSSLKLYSRSGNVEDLPTEEDIRHCRRVVRLFRSELYRIERSRGISPHQYEEIRTLTVPSMVQEIRFTDRADLGLSNTNCPEGEIAERCRHQGQLETDIPSGASEHELS